MITLERVGAALGATAVALGAFGAHGLEGRLTPSALATFETAALYHLVHAVAIVAVGLAARADRPFLKGPGWVLTAGTVLFATVLYALALGGPSILGAVAPVGGATMIAGWVWLLVRMGRGAAA